MAGTVAEETAHGLALQHLAAAVAKGAVTACGDTITRGRTTWECIRPPHGGDHPAMDDHRRRAGESVSADRHYYRPVTQ